MKTKQFFIATTLFAVGTMIINADTITVEDGKITALTPEASSASDTYVVGSGQLVLNAGSSNTFASNVTLTGEGHKKEGENTTAALRLDGGADLTGTLTIGATTNIWSSGDQNGTNTISGNITVSEGLDPKTVVNITNGIPLTLSGESIRLPSLEIAHYASVTFNSSDISFEHIGGTGAVTFLAGSSINLRENDILVINGSSLTFGDQTLAKDVDLAGVDFEKIVGFFTGAEIEGIHFDPQNDTLTITTIPEPSIFGLFSGLGVLVFAISRRRRSVKAR